MEIGPVTIRAVPTVAAPRFDTGRPLPAARTELPPHAAVPGIGVAASTSAAADNASTVERTITIDPDTRSLVSRTFGAEGDLLSQVPDQALLRVKAYARQVVAELDARDKRRRVERIA